MRTMMPRREPMSYKSSSSIRSTMSRKSSHISWMRVLLLLYCVDSMLIFASAQETSTQEEAPEPVVDVLFPWFSLIIGTFAYFLLSRLLPWLPYTAVMFIIGTMIGSAVVRLHNDTLLTESVTDWLNIDSEVLLLVFLPGLVAKDAMQLNATLFRAAFWQCIVFAFPMVLAGTTLTALIVYYIFPYGWSFNFAMTVGSILSATDPVAVAALMSELGAPPRLQIHISGESLLNDGSAIVFFTIFSELYLLELGVSGLGTSIDFAQGLAMFFRMSLGATAAGLFFGLGTLGLVFLLHRRLSREENIVEVATIVTMAYLCYFVTDVVWGCSGVIGTLTYGVVINLGSSSINDKKLQEDFWSLVEHFLNTVLFTLGGMVWGEIIANTDSEKQFTSKDWGYLFVLYIFLILIRFALMFASYPITVSIGLRTNWQETVFSSYAGLRGAVGIALAIYIDNVVNAQDIPEYEQDTNLLFGFVGGIAFLTLVVNATTAGPLLKKLGLADESALRKKVIRGLHFRIRQRVIDDMIALLSEPRFHRVNFAVVRHHIPLIQDLELAELEAALRRFQRPKGKFHMRSSLPNLNSVTSFLVKDQERDGTGIVEINKLLQSLSEKYDEDKHVWYQLQRRGLGSSEGASLDISECRCLFLELLRASYAWQVECGELAERGFLVHILNQSLDFAAVDVSKGLPLDDFSHMDIVQGQFPMVQTLTNFCLRFLGKKANQTVQYMNLRRDVERYMAFLEAHRHSQEVFKNEFVGSIENLTEAEATVLKESDVVCARATALLESIPSHTVDEIVSHQFCCILLNMGVRHFNNLAESGLLTPKEAEEFLKKIQDLMLQVNACAEAHPN